MSYVVEFLDGQDIVVEDLTFPDLKGHWVKAFERKKQRKIHPRIENVGATARAPFPVHFVWLRPKMEGEQGVPTRESLSMAVRVFNCQVLTFVDMIRASRFIHPGHVERLLSQTNHVHRARSCSAIPVREQNKIQFIPLGTLFISKASTHLAMFGVQPHDTRRSLRLHNGTERVPLLGVYPVRPLTR
jgi:hypothetical protein